MIPVNVFFRGFFWVNVLLIPVYYWLFYIMRGLGEGVMGQFLYFVFFSFLYQIASLISLIVLAKLVDRLFFKIKFDLYSKSASARGIVYSAFISAVLGALIANIGFDNLFQFKEGNYALVFMPFGLLLGYYLICYGIGGGR
jgi:hypothetical protein